MGSRPEGDGSPEASPDNRFGPLQLGDRIVMVNGKKTMGHAEVLAAITELAATGEPLPLQVRRDPDQKPIKQYRRDRLYNWSTKAYWFVVFWLLVGFLALITWIGWKLSQLEPHVPNENETMDFSHPYGPGFRRGMHGGHHFMTEL